MKKKKQETIHFRGFLFALTFFVSIWGGGTAYADYTYTFYYNNSNSYSDVKAYVWTEEGSSATGYLGTWPGSSPSSISGNILTFTFTTSEELSSPKVIFNYNNASTQTGNLDLANGATYSGTINGSDESAITANVYYLYTTGKWEGTGATTFSQNSNGTYSATCVASSYASNDVFYFGIKQFGGNVYGSNNSGGSEITLNTSTSLYSGSQNYHFTPTSGKSYTFTMTESNGVPATVTVKETSSGSSESSSSDDYKTSDGYYYYLVVAEKGTFTGTDNAFVSTGSLKYYPVIENGKTTSGLALGSVTIDLASENITDDWWKTVQGDNSDYAGLAFWFIQTSKKEGYSEGTKIYNDADGKSNNLAQGTIENGTYWGGDGKKAIGILKAADFKAESQLSFVIEKKDNLNSGDPGYNNTFRQFKLLGVLKDESAKIEIPSSEVTSPKFIRTFSSTQAYDLPNNVNAYVVHSFNQLSGDTNKDGQLTLRRIKYIPANEGVVLIGTGDTENYTLIPRYETSSKTGSDIWYKTYNDGSSYNNYLVGTMNTTASIVEGKYTENNGNYTYSERYFVLQHYKNCTDYSDGDTDYIGFFRTIQNGTTVGTNKAYLSLPSGIMSYSGQHLGNTYDDPDNTYNTSKCSLWFDDIDGVEEGTTTISGVQQQTVDSTAWFTLQGVQISKPTRSGVYIHGSQKVYVK